MKAFPEGSSQSGGVISGSTTSNGNANELLQTNNAGVVVSSPEKWDGTAYTFQNTARTGLGTMLFTPGAAAASGTFALNSGSNFTFDLGVGAANQIVIGDPLGTGTTANLQILATGGVTLRGNAGQNIDVGQAANRILVRGATSDLITSIATFDLSNSVLGGVSTFKLLRTNTAGGTTGAQTINRPNGSVNFAAAATTLVVTNSTVTATSNIIASVQTADATATIKNVVPAAGSFTITLTAAATAETRVAFWVFN